MPSDTRIHLDLDAVTRDDAVKEPFVFNWKGHTISLSDPAELDWGDLLEVETPIGFLKYTASQEDRNFLASDEGRMEGWRINKMIKAYYEHFGLDPKRSKMGI